MRIFSEQLFIILIIFVRDSSCVFETLYDIGKKVWKLDSLINKVDLALWQDHRMMGNSSYQELREHIHRIHMQLNAMENSIAPNVIHSFMEMMRSNVMVVKSLDTMQLYVESIDDDYKEFNNRFFNGQLEKLDTLIFPNIESKIQMIRKLMIDAKDLLQDSKNLVDAIAAYVVTKNGGMCGGPQLFTTSLVQLFKIAVIAEMKSLIILNVANRYRYSENEEWQLLNLQSKWKFQSNFGSYVNIVELNLNLTDGSNMRACDPENNNWILNENFYELKNIFKAVIFQYRPEFCLSRTCESVVRGRWYECNARNYTDRRGCSRTATSCTELGPVQACLSKNYPETLQYINSTMGLLGRNVECLSNNGFIIRDPSYSTCVCDCYEEHNKISLFIVESRWESNMVITGLRFLRQNDILWIQPREGKLMANGYIDPNSEQWITIPNIPEFTERALIRTIDKSNNLFFLDDIRLPAYHVLTGVQFHYLKRGPVSGFGIKILGVAFNYTTGQLDTSSEIEQFEGTDVSGQNLTFEPINPLQMKLHESLSSHGKYVELRRSSLNEDFGQSTLPLFDAVPITSNPSSALGGVGIFHKGADSDAGFIALKVFGIRDFERKWIITEVKWVESERRRLYRIIPKRKANDEYFQNFNDDERIIDLNTSESGAKWSQLRSGAKRNTKQSNVRSEQNENEMEK